MRYATNTVRLYRANCPFLLGLVRICEVFCHVHDVSIVLEELRIETAAVIRYEFLPRTIAEYRGIYEILGYLRCGDILHRQRLGQLRVAICDDEKVLILPLCADKSANDIDAH